MAEQIATVEKKHQDLGIYGPGTNEHVPPQNHKNNRPRGEPFRGAFEPRPMRNPFRNQTTVPGQHLARPKNRIIQGG